MEKNKLRRAVHGILLLDKPLRLSSNNALQHAKRLYRAQKAGHTGSLDPLATGVLPICFGEAAKYSQYLLDADKIYTVWGRLGFTTITGDAEGKPLVVDNAPVISADIFEKALKNFSGPISQIPPMYSALKKEGVPLYQLARQGQSVERKPRAVTIYSIHLDEYHYPDFKITVHCSKGTYIRTLVEDIGRHLDTGAYLLNLRREKAGPYSLSHAITLEELTSMTDEMRQAQLLPIDTAMVHYPALHLDETQVRQLQCGQTVALRKPLPLGIIRIYTMENSFVGLGEVLEENYLCAKRLMQHHES